MDIDKCRVIKIGKEALLEFIYESLIDKQEDFFDVEPTEVTSHFHIDIQSGEFICVIHHSEDACGNIISLPRGFDVSKLMGNMKDTTDTLYQENRYTELSFDEIADIQNHKPTQ